MKVQKMTRIHGDLECHKIDKAVREYSIEIHSFVTQRFLSIFQLLN